MPRDDVKMDTPEKFRVDCPCGDHVLVSEGAAGCVFTCSCGKPIQIPSSIQLRLNAGLKPIVPPEEVIEGMLYSGAVPGRGVCTHCSGETRNIVRVMAECERVFTRKSGGFSWTILILSMIFLPLRIFHWETPQEQQFGSDKIYPLPVFVCDQCTSALSNAATLKRCLCRIPEYRDLFDKFPNAKFSLIR
jgi:hypothetical protein